MRKDQHDSGSVQNQPEKLLAGLGRMRANVQLDSPVCQLATELLRVHGSLRLRATGFSMLPAIQSGDILFVHRCAIHEVRPGEVAFFSCYGGVVAHRMIARMQECMIAQGDTVPSPDPPVTAENLLGVVVSIERDGKSFAPPLRPDLFSRLTATLLRRSHFALRVWLKVHGRSKKPRHNTNTSVDQGRFGMLG